MSVATICCEYAMSWLAFGNDEVTITGSGSASNTMSSTATADPDCTAHVVALRQRLSTPRYTTVRYSLAEITAPFISNEVFGLTVVLNVI